MDEANAGSASKKVVEDDDESSSLSDAEETAAKPTPAAPAKSEAPSTAAASE